MTNADRIRNMSDEDLARFMNACYCHAHWGMDCGYITCKSMKGDWCNGIASRVDQNYLKWLREEVE